MQHVKKNTPKDDSYQQLQSIPYKIKTTLIHYKKYHSINDKNRKEQRCSENDSRRHNIYLSDE